MKIGIFIAYLSIKSGGRFSYANGLINMLARDSRVEKIVLFYSKDQEEYLNTVFNKERKILSYRVNIKENIFKHFLSRSSNFINYLLEIIGSRYMKKLGFIIAMAQFLNPYRWLFEKVDVDVIHVPFQISPVYNIKCPVIITMHDLQELCFPEFFTAEARVKRAIAHKHAIEQSRHIIVSFDHIKRDILKYFDVPESKVSVCPLTFAEEWFQNSIPTDDDIVANKYKLPQQFILYPAATWPHKNHINLINALKILSNKDIKINLVCTGNQTEHYTKIAEEVKKLRLESQIKFLGIVPESDLIRLYKMTDLVVIPTLYEAGSGPLFEAMRYHVHVICSNVTSLPETIGRQEFIFNPNDADEIAQLIEKGCFDKEFRARNIQNSKLRIKYYKDLDSIDCFLGAYSKCKDSPLKGHSL